MVGVGIDRDVNTDSTVSTIEDAASCGSTRAGMPEWMLPDPLQHENLRVMFSQERSKDYEAADYLGFISRKRKRKEDRRWHMDACNRWEIGEWCYGGM